MLDGVEVLDRFVERTNQTMDGRVEVRLGKTSETRQSSLLENWFYGRSFCVSPLRKSTQH